MEALRIFYKEDGEVIWTHGLEGDGVFPTKVNDDLKELPKGTKCLVLSEQDEIIAFMASDTNKMEDDVLFIGEPKPEPSPEPVRNLAAEIDKMKIEISNLITQLGKQ